MLYAGVQLIQSYPGHLAFVFEQCPMFYFHKSMKIRRATMMMTITDYQKRFIMGQVK